MAHLKPFIRRFRIPLLAAALLLVAAGVFLAVRLRPRPETGKPPVPVVVDRGTTEAGLPAPESGLQRISLRLSPGQAEPQAAEPLAVATGEPLSPEQVEAILSRLSPLEAGLEDQVDFRPAQDPIPPPLPGQTIEQSFPPPPEAVQPEPVPAGPLEVLRYSPEGQVPIAPLVSVTFNQPMVPVGTLGNLAAGAAPVQLEPSLPGVWRWLGTKSLTFQYDSTLIDRLPKATEYRVTVPAGTQSATGGVLENTVSWTFTTPPPQVIAAYPPAEDPQGLNPLFFIAFDQRIDPAAVLGTIEVSAGGGPLGLALAPAEEVQADEQVAGLAETAGEGRWLAFRAVEPLPLDTAVTVTVGPGTPSAEGPLATTEAHSYSFHTYAPLRVVEHGCSWSSDDCPPLTPFYVRFNNPIDVAASPAAPLTIQPELPGVSVNIFGDTLEIRGSTQGRTDYTVVLSGDLQDRFGQKLGEDTPLTFRVGPAEPVLIGPDRPFVTLDPAAARPVLSVYTINYSELDLSVYAVKPSDWPAFKRYLQDVARTDVVVTPPGSLVLQKTVAVDAPPDTLTEVGLDLSEVAQGASGQFVVVVKPRPGLLQIRPSEYLREVHAWAQITQIGLDAFSDGSQMVAWATALKDGAPLAGVTISPGPAGNPAVTGADGVARFDVLGGASYLLASLGEDQALLPRSPYVWDDGSWERYSPNDELRWYVFDDRQMYRPGEEVHLKGWLRRIGRGPEGDIGPVGAGLTAVNYQVTDPQGNDLGGGRAEINLLGGFDFVFAIPQKTNLGYAQVSLTVEGDPAGLDGLMHYHGFQVQEFRRPEFEVTARNESPGPYFAGSSATVAAKASYYAGDPLPDAEVAWLVTTSPGHYAPPNWPDFTFGAWQPWWMYDFFMGWGGYEGEPTTETFAGRTDAAGEHYLQLDFDASGEPRPFTILAEATVIDVNRQAWTGSTNLLVHPAELYVGLRSSSYFVEAGTPLVIDTIVTDLDGNPVAGRPVEVRAARLEWKYVQENWEEQEVDPQTCTLVSTAEPQACTFNTPQGGTYQITARVTDEQGRQNQSRFTRWVSGGQQPPARQVEQETLTLVPDKETYQPGEVAHLLVQSPISPAEGLLTVSRGGILYTQRFRIEAGSVTLDVPIAEQHVPNLTVQVDVAGAAPRLGDQGEAVPNAPSRPAFASGQLNLKIPPLTRTLSIDLAPERAELEPGGETVLAVSVKDAAGLPVPDAELAVVVVDEAILALTGYQLTDPLSVFYAERPANVMSVYGRAAIVLDDPQSLASRAGQEMLSGSVQALSGRGAVEAPAAAEAEMALPTMVAKELYAADQAQQASPIQIRTDFTPLAVFAPAVRTDVNGQAFVPVKLPDNLTRYRVMAVAVDAGRQFGKGETNLIARLPLMVRPSPPRFLNFGDQFELPVVLQNGTDEPLAVEVAIRTANLTLTGSSGLLVTVPPRDRVEVRFPAAAQLAGTARFQVAAVAGAYADAASGELPVYTPATSEAFATYGVIDEGAVLQPVAAPTGVFPQYGGLEIQTSSTALQALSDAVLYLVSYPYDCAEQYASRILAIAALRDVLAAFDAEDLPGPAELEAAVAQDIEALRGLQNSDGGFPYWRRGQDSIPFVSIHVAHALQRAQVMGFAVPPEMTSPLLEHLRQIENYFPEWYSAATRQTLSAYAIYVRHLLGDSDPNKALQVLHASSLEETPLDAVGWLWPVLSGSPDAAGDLEAIRRHVTNRAVETAGAANFTTETDDQAYLLLRSDRRTDAILLEALMLDNPQHDLIPKLVNGLLAHRTRGRWNNTQENVFVLLALHRYFNTYEAQEPDFVARAWLGSTYAGSQTFRGRTTDRFETQVPMTYLTDPALGGGVTQDLILSKEGQGRLYYRLGLRYAPVDLELDPLDMGFVVERSYEAVDDPGDVYRDESGAWHIEAGARLRVRLKLVADNRRYHVALADPLPAGLEILNADLAVTGGLPPQDPGGSGDRPFWWWWNWYEHQNLRDERAEVFTSLLWDGVYEYTYFARATTPGRFVVPPAKAEEMYSPEVFGRSATAIVIVE